MNDSVNKVLLLTDYSYKLSKAVFELVNDPNAKRESIANDLLEIIEDMSKDIGPECGRAAV